MWLHSWVPAKAASTAQAGIVELLQAQVSPCNTMHRKVARHEKFPCTKFDSHYTLCQILKSNKHYTAVENIDVFLISSNVRLWFSALSRGRHRKPSRLFVSRKRGQVLLSAAICNITESS